MAHLPIYCCCDSNITTKEEAAIVEALREFQCMFPGQEIRNFGRKTWSANRSYDSADWYVQHARRIYKPEVGHLQLDAESIVKLMANEPWQKIRPHIDVIFVSDDLSTDWLNFCFGLAHGRITVQSVYRHRGLSDADKALNIKAVVLHELGHVLGMAADPLREKTESKLGMHCIQHSCIMQQGMNVVEFLQHAKEARALGRWYCPLCMRDAKRHLA